MARKPKIKSETPPPAAPPANPSIPAEPNPDVKADAGAVLNKAKAAFDEYRAKISGASVHPSHEGRAQKAPRFPPGAPPMFAVPSSGVPTASHGIVWPGGLGGPVSSAVPAGPLADRIGQMLRMGVEFAIAAFTGGVQVMQAFADGGLEPTPGRMSGARGNGGCGCDCYDGDCDECGEACGCSHEENECCRVGIRNCRSCC